MTEIVSDIENATQTVKRVASGAVGDLKLGSVEAVLWEGWFLNNLIGLDL